MKKVVVLTNSKDEENTDLVINKLTELGEKTLRIDVDKITSGEHSLSINYSDSTRVTYNDNEIDSVKSIWFRRPFSFDFNIVDEKQSGLAEEEFRDVLSGLFLIWENENWVSRPDSINRARIKPYQLHVAKSIGFNVAETLITNDPISARNFCQKDVAVFKPMTGYCLEYNDEVHTAFTSLINEVDYDMLNLVKNQHVMIQRYVEKSSEIRVTCVGNKIFATSISCSNFEKVVDQRTPGNYERLEYKPTLLPEKIEFKIRQLMNRLDLKYAAIDLAIDREKNYTFFEVNPIGQWLWIEEITGQPISDALAEYLATEK